MAWFPLRRMMPIAPPAGVAKAQIHSSFVVIYDFIVIFSIWSFLDSVEYHLDEVIDGALVACIGMLGASVSNDHAASQCLVSEQQR